MSPYPVAFEQLFCPGSGAFASLFSKNPNLMGVSPGGGGGGGGRARALLELTDALPNDQPFINLIIQNVENTQNTACLNTLHELKCFHVKCLDTT